MVASVPLIEQRSNFSMFRLRSEAMKSSLVEEMAMSKRATLPGTVATISKGSEQSPSSSNIEAVNWNVSPKSWPVHTSEGASTSGFST